MNNEQERFNELAERVIAWADQKGILEKGTPDAQFGKFLEECTELWKAIVVGDKGQIKDGVGDVAVTIIIWAKLSNIELRMGRNFPKYMNPEFYVGCVMECMLNANRLDENQEGAEDLLTCALDDLSNVPSMLTEDWLDCLEYSLNIIEKRTGRMVNGTFVKDVNNELLLD